MNKTAVMTEARLIGGTCVNRGCLPSKNLIAAAKLVYDDHILVTLAAFAKST